MLYLSHRIDRLVDFLAERLWAADNNPFQRRWILLPSRINQQWLLSALSQRKKGGALLGLEMMSWRDALVKLSRLIPGDLELRLSLLQLFEKKDLPSAFAPLAQWLQAESGETLRKISLSRILSCQILEAGFYGLESSCEWQKELMRALTVDGPWRFPDQLLESAAPPSADLHCFCIDEMPDKAWDFFLRGGAAIYQFSPCKMYWGDLCSERERGQLIRKWGKAKNVEEFEGYLKDTHPLLSNWGKLGRKAMQHFEDLESVEAYEMQGEASLLQKLQRDLLELRTLQDHPREEIAPDGSLEVVQAGSSRLRELEILRERLLAWFQRTQAAPADVLVLAPDIKTYEPLIHFVFGDELALRIGPISALSSNLFLQGLLLFFSLASGRWEADLVLELFENRSFREKQSLEDLELLRSWMQDAKIRSGWEDKQGNWTEGLRRMLLSLACLFPEDSALQVRNLDFGQADKLEQFLELLQMLRKRAAQFEARETRLLREWAELLSETAEELFKPETREKEPFTRFLQELFSAAEKFPDDHFSWPILQSLFEDACQGEATSYQAHLWQAVQFSSLQPGVLRPAKAVFLLGMESDHFPRQQLLGSFQWDSPVPKSVDRDRYLLLQVLFAAKEHLSISYCHISPDDGKEVEVALPVQELLQTVDLFYCLEKKMILAYPARRRDFSSIRPTPFWPRVSLAQEPLQYDLKELFACAKNPWKFFLQKTLGVHLREELLFSEMRTEDFELPIYVKRDLVLASLHQPLDELLERRAHLLPPGVFGEGERVKLEALSREWKEALNKWEVDFKEVHSIRFSPRCRAERSLKEGWIEAPALQLDLDGRQVQIVGELRNVVSSGLLLENGGTKWKLTLRHWPLLLVNLLYTKQKSAFLYSLASGSSFQWEIDARSALCRWLRYFALAKQSLSPLIAPWAEIFLLKGKEEWKSSAHEKLVAEEDRWIRWVAARADPLPLDSIWGKWSEPLQETFAELLHANV